MGKGKHKQAVQAGVVGKINSVESNPKQDPVITHPTFAGTRSTELKLNRSFSDGTLNKKKQVVSQPESHGLSKLILSKQARIEELAKQLKLKEIEIDALKLKKGMLEIENKHLDVGVKHLLSENKQLNDTKKSLDAEKNLLQASLDECRVSLKDILGTVTEMENELIKYNSNMPKHAMQESIKQDLPVEQFKTTLEKLDEAILVLEEKANQTNLEKAFYKALREQYHMLAVDYDDSEISIQLCEHTYHFLNEFTQTSDRLQALQDFENDCVKTPGFENFLKVIAAVMITAAAIILGATVGIGVGALAGSLGGPVGGGLGAIFGAIKGASIGYQVGLAATTGAACLLGFAASHHLFFKLNPQEALNRRVLDTAKEVERSFSP